MARSTCRFVAWHDCQPWAAVPPPAEEDVKLIQLVETYGPQNWSLIAKSLGSGRNGKSCRLRWFNQLDPSLKKEPFSAEEVSRPNGEL